MPIYLMLKANDTSNYNARVNWWYASALGEDALWSDLQAEAEQICASKGWSLINVRPVPRDTALERIESQAR